MINLWLQSWSGDYRLTGTSARESECFWTKTLLFSGLMAGGCVVPQLRLCLDRSLITLSGTPERFSQERGLCVAGPVTRGLAGALQPIVRRWPRRVGYLLLGKNTIGHSFQHDGGQQICHADQSTELQLCLITTPHHHARLSQCSRNKGCALVVFFLKLKEIKAYSVWTHLLFFFF